MSSGVNGITSNTDTGNNTQITNTANNMLDKDAFFKLLITQLQNQDPLNPMKDREFIAQMAQFSSLEQMQNMNKNMKEFLQIKSLAEGASLIGKTVEKVIKDEDKGEEEVIEGKVTRVIFEDGNSYVELDGEQKLDIKDISAIY